MRRAVGRGEHFRDAVALDDFPGGAGIGEVDGAFAKQRGDAGAERGVDDVGMADDPSDVGGAPENVALADVEETFEMVSGADHVSAVNVQDALRLAGGTGGVEQEERIFGVHFFGGTFWRELEQVVEIDFARGGDFGFGARIDDDFLDEVERFQSFVDDGLEGDGFAAAEADVAGDDDFRLRVGDAVAKRGVSQAGVDDGMNCADAGAGQHGHCAFDGERHVDDDAVALDHSQGLQAIGEAADLAVELAVGDDALGAVLAQPDEGGAIAAVGVGVTVERIDGDVGLRAGEPLMMDAVPVENLGPRLRPLEAAGVVAPKSLRDLSASAGTLQRNSAGGNFAPRSAGRGIPHGLLIDLKCLRLR